MKRTYLLYMFIATFAMSCSYVNESDLTEDIEVEGFVTYEANVKPIIDTNCIFCHDTPPVNGAPMSLITYDEVVEAVENRNLIGRISAMDGSVMPAGGPRLPQNLIDLVIQWEEEGFLEN